MEKEDQVKNEIQINKEEKGRKRKAALIIIIIVIAAAVAAGIIISRNVGPGNPATQAKEPDLDEDAVNWQGEKTQQDEGGVSEGIAIPGYKSISLKADQTEQSVNLFNPESNDCYFVISLILPDGTRIWQSKMIPPGKGLYQITLDQTVPAGSYEDSILKYECYKMDDDLTKLNGGEVKLVLEVE